MTNYLHHQNIPQIMVESITKPTVSATEPDWSREKSSRWWQPSCQLLKSLRNYQKWQQYGGVLGYVLCRLNVIQHRFWTVVTGTDIPLNCQIKGGLLYHFFKVMQDLCKNSKTELSMSGGILSLSHL